MGSLVDKPWGYEHIYPVGKILFVKKGKRLSLQYHEKKSEVMYVWRGLVEITLGETSGRLAAGSEPISIAPGVIHRVEALEDSFIIELSTAELDDVVRIEDDYGRVKVESGIGNKV